MPREWIGPDRWMMMDEPKGCIHLGADTGVDLPCACPGAKADVYRCAHPETPGGICTLAKQVGNVCCCVRCPRKEIKT